MDVVTEFGRYNFHKEDFRKEVRRVLTSDMVYRRERRWPLSISKGRSLITEHNALDAHFPGLRELLNKYRGKLVLCGGLVTRLYFSMYILDHYVQLDADFFFYNVSIPEANMILEDCIAYLVSHKSHNAPADIRIERRKNITNVVVQREYGYRGLITRVYQFVHRLYPTLDSILGGFDIPYCMLAYDGEQIYATPIAEWCLEKKVHIIDTTRRSLSYARRVQKYCRTYSTMNVFFPGLSYDWLPHKKDAADVKSFAEQLIKMIDENGFILWDSEGKKTQTVSTLSWSLVGKCLGTVKRVSEFKIKHGVDTECPAQKVRGKEFSARNLELYSDYSDSKIPVEFIAQSNSTMIRCDNLEGVIAFKQYLPDESVSYEQARKDFCELVESPEIKILPLNPNSMKRIWSEKTRQRVGILGTLWSKHTKYPPYLKEAEELRLELNEHVRSKAEHIEIWLKGNSWITENPGRQWTSSINPIMEDPRQFYGPEYVPFRIGIPEEIETTLRLGFKDPGSVLSKLPRVLFNLLLRYVVRHYM